MHPLPPPPFAKTFQTKVENNLMISIAKNLWVRYKPGIMHYWTNSQYGVGSMALPREEII